MQSSDATPNKQNPEHGREASASDAEGTPGPDGATTGKPARKDAETLPDGSNSDSRQSSEDHGQENGEQSFDAG